MICLVGAQSPAPSPGQAPGKTPTITFPEGADLQSQIASSMPADLGAGFVPTDPSQLTQALKGKADTDLVILQDQKTGNAVMRKVKDVKVGWVLTRSDLNLVSTIKVLVDRGGKPVDVATLQLKHGGEVESQLIDPASNGEAIFRMVKPGSLTVTVHYKSAGVMATPVTQIFELSLTRPDPVPVFKISLPADAMATPATPNAPADSVTTAAPQEIPRAKTVPPTSGLGKIVVWLLGLVVVAGLVWVALSYAKMNPQTVSARLEQLGVQIPKPAAHPLTTPAAAPATPMAPQPIQKIVLPDAAPDPIAPVTPSPFLAVSAGEPRLIAESGAIIPLPEGAADVGRDISMPISLNAETSVSRRHAQFTRSGSQVGLTDMGSTNGTYVNGVKIEVLTALNAGDTVQFGSARFRYEG